jgi:hypothetical protein
MTESAQATNHLSLDDRLAITQGVMNLFDSWGLRAEEGMALLDIKGKPRHFMQYRHNKPFPEDPKLMKRVEYLIRIDAALHTTYPTNATMGKRWLRQRSRRLNSRSPLSTMINDGEQGLVNVLCQLDCTFAWDLSGSKAN